MTRKPSAATLYKNLTGWLEEHGWGHWDGESFQVPDDKAGTVAQLLRELQHSIVWEQINPHKDTK